MFTEQRQALNQQARHSSAASTSSGEHVSSQLNWSYFNSVFCQFIVLSLSLSLDNLSSMQRRRHPQGQLSSSALGQQCEQTPYTRSSLFVFFVFFFSLLNLWFCFKLDSTVLVLSSICVLIYMQVNLEVHSTPVSLTTRSLSNRRATSLHGNSVHSVQQRPSSMSSGRDKRHRGLQTASHSAAIGRSLHTRSGRRSRDGDLTSVRVGAGESSSHCKPKSGRASRRSLMAAQFSGGGSVRSDAAECSVDSGRPPHSGTVTRPDQPVAEEQKWSERQTTGQGAGVVVSGSFGQRTNESAPVNQQILKSKNTSHGDEVVRRIRVGGRGGGGEVEAGGGEGEVEAAVRKLQRWYRGCKERQRAHMAEVRSLLRVKREELDRSRSEQQERLQAEVSIEAEYTLVASYRGTLPPKYDPTLQYKYWLRFQLFGQCPCMSVSVCVFCTGGEQGAWGGGEEAATAGEDAGGQAGGHPQPTPEEGGEEEGRGEGRAGRDCEWSI